MGCANEVRKGPILVYLGYMRKLLSIVLIFLAWPILAQQGFVRNDGQWNDPSQFVYRFGPNAVFFTTDSLVFAVLDPDDFHPEHDEKGPHHYEDRLHFQYFSIRPEGSNGLHWEGLQEHRHYNNFYKGKPDAWRSHVPGFNVLVARDVYAGIDLKVYESPGGLKYDWIVHAGARPEEIELTYHGIESLRAGRKNLVLQTGIGPIKEELPRAYQGADEVDADYKALGTNRVQMVVKDYDPTEELVIDPIYIFSTYTGSSSDNFGYSATFDDDGNAYGGGIVFGAGYPTTLGTLDTTFDGGIFDIALSKFSSDGTQLVWSTYMGGGSLDQPHSLECDEDGNLYIFGITGSNDFAVHPASYDTSYGGGQSKTIEYYTFYTGTDMFVALLSAAGDSLLGSTYLGGPNNEGYNGALAHNYGDSFRGEIELQRGGGKVYIVSSADSTGYPTTPGARTHIGGQDGVVSVLNRSLDTLVSSTYVGTSGDDALYSIALAEKNGNATNSTRLFLAGGVETSDNVIYLGRDSLQINVLGGHSGLLLAAHMDTTLHFLAANATMEPGYDQHYFVEVNSPSDTASLVTVVGQTKAALAATDTNFWGQPGSAQYFQQYKYNPIIYDFDLVRTAVWGDGQRAEVDVSPTAMLVDYCGNLYFSGWGGSPNYEGDTYSLQTTPNAPRTQTDGRDFYFLVLDRSWENALMATYWGGTGREHVDGGTSRFDSKGRIFQAVCAGCGGNSDYPAFPSNVWSTTNNSSNCNLAVTVIDLDVQQANASVSAPVELCFPYALELRDSSENVDLWSMYWGDGTSALNLDSLANHMYASPGTYAVTLIGQDTACNTFDTTTLSVEILPPYDSVYLDLTYDPCNTDANLNPLFAEVRLMKDSTLATDYQMNWLYMTYPGTGFIGQGAQFSNVLGRDGDNVLSVSVYDPVCGITQNLVVTVRFEPPVSAFIELEIPPCVSTEPAVFTAFTNADITSWYVNGDSIGPAWPLEIDQSGTYEISFVLGNSVCNTWDTITINPTIVGGDTTVAVANVITPNGDNVNDRWQLIGSTTWDEFHIILYNRWGLKVFETTSPTFSWGADYDGKILSPGVYFYQVEARNNCSDIKEEGTLHITY